MAEAKDILYDWIGTDREKNTLMASSPELPIRWLNEANQRYCDLSESIQDIWQPIIDSTGIAPLPDDWLRDIKDRIQWTNNVYLTAIDYPTALSRRFTGTFYYSIWKGQFYVWSPAAGSPIVPYIRRPDQITVSNFATYTLDVLREKQQNMISFLDSKWARYNKDVKGELELRDLFDEQARRDGQNFRDRREPLPQIRGRWF